MNKIVINQNKILDYEDDFITIRDAKIMFKKNGEYTIEYVNSDVVHLDMIVLANVLVKLFIWSENNALEVCHTYQLGDFSQLLLFQFYHNKSVIEEDVIQLNGEFSNFSSGFSSISEGSEEYHIIVNHNNRSVSSSICNKCIGMDGSRIHFQIDSILEKGNENCVMDQSTKILTLGEVDTRIEPNMFCDENSVEARHGSVVGKFGEEEVFYLMSRGISRDEAMVLLMKGFIFSNLVVDMEKRAKIFQCIQDLRR